MILQALYQLAEREHLMEDPDFEWKPLAWLLTIGKDGSLRGIKGTHWIPPEEEGRKKPKPRPKSFAVPRESGRTSGDRAFFLFDKAEYALGLDPAGERPAEKLAARLGLFRDRAEECLTATGDEGVRAVCSFLSKLQDGSIQVELPEGCASNELFGFIFSPDVDELVTSRPLVREYWRSLRVLPDGAEADLRRCLVSGRLAPPVDKLPAIKNVPGGTTSGVALVSFNAGAFESYGWSGNENATLSREAAEACSTALNRLLHSAFPNPARPGETLPSRHLRLSADTAVCFWARSPQGEDLASVLIGLFEANPEKVGELYRSIWRGIPVRLKDPTAFYALTLSGAQGRAIVRDWFEATVEQVDENLAQHFKDLAIVRNARRRDDQTSPALELRTLLRSLAVRGEDKRIPAALSGEIVHAALAGTVYPQSIVARAVERSRAEIGGNEWADRERSDGRAALIKAVLNRRRRFHLATTSYPEIGEAMDPNNTSPSYLLGRLMAVAERMQSAALGQDVNATVVDKLFGAASATPNAVFTRLMKGFRHHARKAKDGEFARLANKLEKQADDILHLLVPDRHAFPPFLPLEQQGLFILGYHHQRYELFHPKPSDRSGDRGTAAVPVPEPATEDQGDSES